MFETAELGRTISKEEYEAARPELRARLLAAQFALRGTRVPVLVIIAGADGAGKGDAVNRLHEWLDPRNLATHVFGPTSDEERERPAGWRFWRTLPARGQIGIFFGSWYTQPIVSRVGGTMKKGRFEIELDRIAFTEEMLVRDGALLLKFWIHLSKSGLKRRFKRLSKSSETRWKVTKLDRERLKTYDDFVAVAERAVQKTDTALAPWIVVEAFDDRWRDLTMGRTLADALERKVKEASAPKPVTSPAVAPLPPLLAEEEARVLDRVDLTSTLSDRAYHRRLARGQERLHQLTWAAAKKRISSVAVFEGWDAAGKGGAIRRMTWAIDARLCRVIPIAAPTDEERAHHYLWRFWRHIPRAGLVTIFDRSWYGRILVERVEGFAREDEWRRAFLEINDFEQQLADAGIVVTKFWLHVSPEEQLRRFEERQHVPHKQHKITEEDWRNRAKWDAYHAAVGEMVARTSTREAPWTLVGANDKNRARIQVIETFCDRLERAL